MKNRILNFILLFSFIILPSIVVSAQYQLVGEQNASQTINYVKNLTVRLDLITESQVDEILNRKRNSLYDLCQLTMTYKKRGDIILTKGDKIKVFVNEDLNSVELVKIDNGTFTVIQQTDKSNLITIDHEITLADRDKYYLVFK